MSPGHNHVNKTFLNRTNELPNETYIVPSIRINENNIFCDKNSNDISTTSDSIEVDFNKSSVSISSGSSCIDSENFSCDVENCNESLNVRSNVNSIESSCRSNGNIEHVSIQNSSDVTFGSKTYFNGPVVIKQIIVDNIKCNQNEQSFDNSKASDKVRNWWREKRNILIFIIILTVAEVLAISILIVYFNVEEEHNHEYEFVTRLEYGAIPPKKEIELLDLPIRRVLIGQTGEQNCSDIESCAQRILSIQSYHMYHADRNWDDIGINFLVGGDGRAYEGCDYREGAHTLFQNNISICIYFIGNFTVYEAPQRQLSAALRLIEDGMKMNKIHPEYTMYGQRQFRSWLGPGYALYKQIMLLSHWSKEIIPL